MPLFFVLFAIGHVLSGAGFEELAALYRYDPSAPLVLKLEPKTSRPSFDLYTVSFQTPAKTHVSGFLLLPHSSGRKPAVIWMHSGGALQWMGDAALLARMGAGSLIVDPDGAFEPKNPELTRDSMIQSVIAIRRGLDILAAREDIDPARIAFVGHSYGSMMGAVAISIDTRFRAAVFEAGLLGMSIHIATSPHPWPTDIRKQLGSGLPHFLEVISVADAAHYIGHAPPIPKLFQSAWFDPGVPHKDAEDFYRAATSPKQLDWYDTGHDIDDLTAISDRARFPAHSLNLKDSERILRDKFKPARRQ
jgi:dienelactone hydrolase